MNPEMTHALSVLAVNEKGQPIEGYIQGSGPTVIIVHPGLDDGTSWGAVAEYLSKDFIVIRPIRRQYSVDRAESCSIADEADEVIKVAEQRIGESYIVGHSSGAIVALHALGQRPELFSKAVLYEPPISIDQPLGGKVTKRLQQAVMAGHYSKALRLFLSDVVKLPRVIAWTAQMVAQSPEYQFLIARQIDDLAAIDAIGDARAAYQQITTPTLLIGGDKSPGHLKRRLQVLQEVLLVATTVRLHGAGHDAHVRMPETLGSTIDEFLLAHRPAEAKTKLNK